MRSADDLDGLPLAYRALLVSDDLGDLYPAEILAERQRTLELARYLPGYFAIGDDGGGRVVLLERRMDSPVWIGGMGALGSAPLTRLAEGVAAWLESGRPLDDAEEDDVPWMVDVWLDAVPEGRLANLLVIKKALGLDLSIAELKARTETLPACLARGVPYGKLRVRTAPLDERFGPCLRLEPA